jgi:hypothetical protein
MQHGTRIRSEEQAGTDFPEIRRLFQNNGIDAMCPQANGRRQPGDAGSHNNDFLGI